VGFPRSRLAGPDIAKPGCAKPSRCLRDVYAKNPPGATSGRGCAGWRRVGPVARRKTIRVPRRTLLESRCSKPSRRHLVLSARQVWGVGAGAAGFPHSRPVVPDTRFSMPAPAAGGPPQNPVVQNPPGATRTLKQCSTWNVGSYQSYLETITSGNFAMKVLEVQGGVGGAGGSAGVAPVWRPAGDPA